MPTATVITPITPDQRRTGRPHQTHAERNQQHQVQQGVPGGPLVGSRRAARRPVEPQVVVAEPRDERGDECSAQPPHDQGQCPRDSNAASGPAAMRGPVRGSGPQARQAAPRGAVEPGHGFQHAASVPGADAGRRPTGTVRRAVLSRPAPRPGLRPSGSLCGSWYIPGYSTRVMSPSVLSANTLAGAGNGQSVGGAMDDEQRDGETRGRHHGVHRGERLLRQRQRALVVDQRIGQVGGDDLGSRLTPSASRPVGIVTPERCRRGCWRL